MRLLLPKHETTSISALIASGWALQMTCAGCEKKAVLGTDRLQALPGDATVGQVYERLVCACGSRDGQVIVISDRSASRYASDGMDGYRETFGKVVFEPVESAAWVGRGKRRK